MKHKEVNIDFVNWTRGSLNIKLLLSPTLASFEFIFPCHPSFSVQKLTSSDVSGNPSVSSAGLRRAPRTDSMLNRQGQLPKTASAKRRRTTAPNTRTRPRPTWWVKREILNMYTHTHKLLCDRKVTTDIDVPFFDTKDVHNEVKTIFYVKAIPLLSKFKIICVQIVCVKMTRSHSIFSVEPCLSDQYAADLLRKTEIMW